jgi:succinate dehydrogenase / fumarate reductase flavoprotein subunit
VHGANRLGTNSLTDLLVFGKSSGDSTVRFLKENPGHKDLPKDAADMTLARLARLDGQADGESVYEVGAEMRRIMQAHCGVFRFPDMLVEGVNKIKATAARAQRTMIKDKSKVFNTARVEALELDNLIEVALATLISAEARKESRGAHDRADHGDTPEHPNGRDDEKWLKHTLWYKQGNRLDYKPVHLKPLTAQSFEPKKRTY